MVCACGAHLERWSTVPKAFAGLTFSLEGSPADPPPCAMPGEEPHRVIQAYLDAFRQSYIQAWPLAMTGAKYDPILYLLGLAERGVGKIEPLCPKELCLSSLCSVALAPQRDPADLAVQMGKMGKWKELSATLWPMGVAQATASATLVVPLAGAGANMPHLSVYLDVFH